MNVASLDSMTPMQPDPSAALLVQRLLREQAELTAVEKFSKHHDTSEFNARAKYYRDLLPLSHPGPGEQYAFRVELDSCSGCKACVSACHELNGLEEEETWREVGLLVGVRAELPILQHVTSACHHCVEPGCLAGCPARAYDKNPQTGIVHHLDDQCIGCQYCVWTCPYEVPKFSVSKGIVRKCDMCHQRLAVGEAPACVQSCPNQAIAIEVVRQDEVRERARRGEFLGAAVDVADSFPAVGQLAPDPGLTAPTTRYVTLRTAGLFAKSADHEMDVPQHAHWPLVIMLVLTQLAVGLILVERALTFAFALGGESDLWSSGQRTMATISWAVTLAGLGLANLHLGRPWLAFRAVLGWRTSWLSREVLAFSALIAINALYALFLWHGNSWGVSRWITEACGVLTALVASGAAAASAMVYVATKREAWSYRRVFWQFGASIVLLGVTSGLVLVGCGRLAWPELHDSATAVAVGRALLAAAAGLTLARVMFVQRTLRRLSLPDPSRQLLTIESRIGRLLNGPLHPVARQRLTFALLAGILFPLLICLAPWTASLVSAPVFMLFQGSMFAAALIVRLVSESLERYLFFVTAVTSKMPGGMP